MTIKIESRPMSDAELRAVEIYRFFYDGHRRTLEWGKKKLLKAEINRLADERTRMDIDRLLRESGL